MSRIHPTAIIDPRAELADDVRVDAYAVIEGRVRIGSGTHLRAHSVLQGHSVIGENCQIGPGAYVGLDPQHTRYDPRVETSLIIGNGVVIRENASLHRAMKPGEAQATRVGDRCFIMSNAHVGHDCIVGNDVTLANNVMLAGHVTVGDRTFMGGGSGAHQFVQIGRLVIVGGLEAVTQDLPPFAAMRYTGLKGYNAIGCRRAGISQQSIDAIRDAYFCIHTHRTLRAATEAIRVSAIADVPEVKEILNFIAGAKRGIPRSVRFLKHLPDHD